MHLGSTADGVSVRVSPESYGSVEEAGDTGRAALTAFGAALQE
jgi:phosphoketolase